MSGKSFRCIIIDDEKHCIETLRYELGRHCPEVEILSSHQDTLKGIKAINDNQPDIVFLDIELSDVSGFELLECLTYKDFQLVFTTAYDQYAVDALRIKAFDYLMKPVSGEDLRQCLDRLNAKDNTHVSTKNDHISKVSNDQKKISVLAGSSTLFLMTDEILYFKADGNFTEIHMISGVKHHASQSLKQIEEVVTQNGFIRTHKSFMINVSHIKAYHKSEGGSLEMIDGTSIPISRMSIKEIVEHINS